MAVAVKLLPGLDHGNEFEKFDQGRNRHDGEATPSISKNKRIRVYHGDTLRQAQGRRRSRRKTRAVFGLTTECTLRRAQGRQRVQRKILG